MVATPEKGVKNLVRTYRIQVSSTLHRFVDSFYTTILSKSKTYFIRNLACLFTQKLSLLIRMGTWCIWRPGILGELRFVGLVWKVLLVIHICTSLGFWTIRNEKFHPLTWIFYLNIKGNAFKRTWISPLTTGLLRPDLPSFTAWRFIFSKTIDFPVNSFTFGSRVPWLPSIWFLLLLK